MAKQSTESKWRARVQAQERSGLTQPAWCKREGIGLSSLGLWRRRLRLSVNVPENKPTSLVPIVVLEPSPAAIEVLVDSGGLRMRATSAIDPAWLASVLRGLR